MDRAQNMDLFEQKMFVGKKYITYKKGMRYKDGNKQKYIVL